MDPRLEQYLKDHCGPRDYGQQDENGVDFSLLREILKLSVEERLARASRARQSALELSEILANSPHKSDLVRIAEILDKHGVESIVIGGQAENIHGSPRVTYDVDLCYRRTPENIHRLALALSELSPKLRDLPEGLPNIVDESTLKMGTNFTLTTSIIDLDLLADVVPIGGYDQLLASALHLQSHGTPLTVISLDDLLKVKLHINRPKDQESIMQLRALKQLRDEAQSS